MTGDEFVGVVFSVFGLIVVVFWLAVEFEPKGYQPPRPPKYRPEPPPAPPARREPGCKPQPPALRDFGVDGRPVVLSSGRLALTRRVEFHPPGQGARLDWAPSRCDYCGRRGGAGVVNCSGCGAPSTSGAVQFVGAEPRRNPDRVEK